MSTRLRLMQWNGARVWAGGEVRTLEACRGLAQRGHSVWCVARGGAPLLGHLQKAGLPTFGIAPHGAADLPRILQAAWIARRERIDLIHAHAGRDYAPAVLAGKLAGCPVVLHRRLYLPLRRSTARLVARHAGAIIAVSTPVEEALRRDGVPAAKVHRIPNGIHPGRVACAPEEAARVRCELGAGDVPLILSVGHLYESKGHDDLVRAAALLRDAGHPFILAIAGEGPEREALDALVASSGLQERVRLLGKRGDVAALLAACDVFALLSWEDPLPGAILEAMASGKPVVACDAGGVPEMVCHEESGLLVPPRSAADAAAALARLLSDRELRERWGASGARRFGEEFGFERMLDRWLAVYAGLLR